MTDPLPYPRPSVEICSNAWNDPTYPSWIDISHLVADGDDEPGWEVTEGRVNALDTAEPGRLRLALRNNDDRFTIGNPTSPYYPWWGQSGRIRMYDTIGNERFDLFDGFVQWPTLTVHVAGTHQLCAISAVDRLGWLQSAPRFVSTLGAYVMSTPGLVAYWPMNEGSGRLFGSKAGNMPGLDAVFGTASGSSSLITLDPSSVTLAPADDVLGPRSAGDAGQFLGVRYQSTFDPDIAVSDGDVITAAAWVNLEDDPTTGHFAHYIWDMGGTLFYLPGPAEWHYTWFDISATFAAVPHTYKGTLLAQRTTPSAGTSELYIDGVLVASDSTGTPISSTTINYAQVGGLVGGVGHVQLYVAPDATYPATKLREQYLHGVEGLEGQLTGERVRTVAGYSGLPAGLVKADKGTVRMSRASLAGRTPLDALREAEVTEQGRLRCDGENVVFWDRRRRYDI